MQTLYQNAFPGFSVPAELFDLDGVEDVSWKNDICPSFTVPFADGFVRIWVDHQDPQMREFGDAYPRFNVHRSDRDGTPVDEFGEEVSHAEDIFTCDDIDDLIAFIVADTLPSTEN